jgi:type I restriction enzyme S subunit
MELKKYKLGEILELQRGYDLPSSQMKIGSVPVAGSNGVIGYHDTARGNYPCITVGRSGSVGKVHYYEQPTWAHNTALFVKNFKGNDPKYLYYFLKNLHLDEMFSKGSSVVPSLDRKVVHSLIVPFQEDKTCQKQIASVLSNIDRKIELNRAINQNLEAMAKQLYDYWFVQFDFPDENGRPYKSSGGEMVWNKKLKREIPKGWNVLKLGERCSFNKRTSSGYFNHSILYLDTSNITNNKIDELQFLNPSSDIIPSRARRLVQEGDIVYSTVRPNLKHFGIIMNPDYNMVVSTGFAVITANWSAYRYFIYQFLIQAATIETLSTIAQSAVSAYPSINTSDIENLDLVVPPDSMIEEYAKISCRLYLQIDANYKEIKFLTKQRDELLPLLMNGQVSVNSDLSDD